MRGKTAGFSIAFLAASLLIFSHTVTFGADIAENISAGTASGDEAEAFSDKLKERFTDTAAGHTDGDGDAQLPDMAPAVNSTEPENSGPEQMEYPGVQNGLLQSGGDGEPSTSLYYPIFGNAKVDADILEYVKEQTASYRQEVNDSIEPDGEKPASFDMWDMTGFYSLGKPNANIASVTFNIYSYSGGAHGNLVINCQNYDLRTGKALEFADLFKDPEKALVIFSELSAKKLHDELGEDADEDMINSGTSQDLRNFSNLSLVPDGLFIEFQPYQVGPWAIGPQRVKISLEEMRAAGPENDIWPPEKP